MSSPGPMAEPHGVADRAPQPLLPIEFALPRYLQSAIGKRCCRIAVGRQRTLSVGFGEFVRRPTRHNPDLVGPEWEIGTYVSAWRVVRDGRVLVGSTTSAESDVELQRRVQAALGRIPWSFEMTSTLDLRILLDDRTCIDLLATTSDDDEMFHAFGPDLFCAVCRCDTGWVVGRLHQPPARG